MTALTAGTHWIVSLSGAGLVAGSAHVLPSGSRLTVASLPPGHPAVCNLDPVWGVGPRRVTPPVGPEALTRRWLATTQADVLHLHAGLVRHPARQAALALRALREHRTPLVLTVHQLRDATRTGRTSYAALLDVLVPAADAVVTLTPGAAAEIEDRWGRAPLVLPHPHVVDLRAMAVAQDCRARRRTSTFRVGLHEGPDAGRVRATLERAVAALPGAVLQPVVGDADDRSLWHDLAAVDLAVLPQRRLTHSTLLEACRDVGATPLVPAGGHLAEQGPLLSYTDGRAGLGRESLVDAVRTAYETRPATGASIDERRAQRQALSEAHDRLYRSLLA